MATEAAVSEVQVDAKVTEKEFPNKPRKLEITELNHGQRLTVREGIGNAFRESKFFGVLGAYQKQLSYDILDMIAKPGAILLDLEGIEYYKKVPVANSQRKENVKYWKWTLNFHVPGTKQVISVDREWPVDNL